MLLPATGITHFQFTRVWTLNCKLLVKGAGGLNHIFVPLGSPLFQISGHSSTITTLNTSQNVSLKSWNHKLPATFPTSPGILHRCPRNYHVRALGFGWIGTSSDSRLSSLERSTGNTPASFMVLATTFSRGAGGVTPWGDTGATASAAAATECTRRLTLSGKAGGRGISSSSPGTASANSMPKTPPWCCALQELIRPFLRGWKFSYISQTYCLHRW